MLYWTALTSIWSSSCGNVSEWQRKSVNKQMDLTLCNMAIVFLLSHFIYLYYLYYINLWIIPQWKPYTNNNSLPTHIISSLRTDASLGHCIFFRIFFFFTFLLSSLLSAASKALQLCLSSHVKLWMLIILRAVRVSTRRQTFYGRGGSKLDPFSCDLPGTYCLQVPYGAGRAKPNYISVF